MKPTNIADLNINSTFEIGNKEKENWEKR